MKSNRVLEGQCHCNHKVSICSIAEILYRPNFSLFGLPADPTFHPLTYRIKSISYHGVAPRLPESVVGRPELLPKFGSTNTTFLRSAVLQVLRRRSSRVQEHPPQIWLVQVRKHFIFFLNTIFLSFNCVIALSLSGVCAETV